MLNSNEKRCQRGGRRFDWQHCNSKQKCLFAKSTVAHSQATISINIQFFCTVFQSTNLNAGKYKLRRGMLIDPHQVSPINIIHKCKLIETTQYLSIITYQNYVGINFH
jgi:hypothetical protein